MSEILLGWFTKPTILWSISDYIVLFIEIIIFSYIAYHIYLVIKKIKKQKKDKK